MGALERLTSALLEHETIDGSEVDMLVRGGSLDDLRRDRSARERDMAKEQAQGRAAEEEAARKSAASDEGGGPMGNPFNIDGDKKGQLVAGKTVMFDGEPIGVRGQNIFDMVHSCYQKKREGKHFIETEMDVATRLPASVKPPRK